MDSIQSQKLQAMRKFKKWQFLNTLILHSVLALMCTLFFSYPFWFPTVNHFALVSLPNFKSFFFNPKFLFIVGNAIVFYLVGESKLSSSSPSSSSTEIYNKYVERSRRIRHVSTQVEKKEEEKFEMNFTEERVKNKDAEETEEEEEEEAGLPTEELNKRVEDFIARVNRQRLVEARFVDCGRG